MAEEDEVVVFGELLEEEPEFTEIGEVHEVGVVKDGGERFAVVVEAEGLFDESSFALESGGFNSIRKASHRIFTVLV